ncbi:hypothetical protein U27_06338 [Candidatus Vecturithrix granuli]|uniref:Uncharacterized protein n=1 Tax=Vecturithrix granuli TaxID=1499967 RepID=A0A081C449_VECG1|nr:hypothetical protein U27_06338 [Candidatus Vecturithrix granuli]
MFQTLPGIIPRFYLTVGIGIYNGNIRFKPFQGLFRVSTARNNSSLDALGYRFKPFQGLFRVSTFPLRRLHRRRMIRFKPFQGLFRVSTDKLRFHADRLLR